MKKLIYLLFGLSGAIGLLYQVVWSRKLLLLFGNTTHSLVTVLAVFMAGLSIGSIVFGYLADKNSRTIRLWGFLEILIGLSAIFFLLALPIVRQIYAPAGSIIKFFAASILLLPATIFMGGTLPVLVKAFISKKKEILSDTSKLYSSNTLGAFLGTLLTGFILIELVGLNNSVILGALVNIAIGIFAIKFLTNQKPKNEEPKTQKTMVSVKTYNAGAIGFTLFVFFLSGAISFSYEILWTRMLIASLGTFTYAFSLILATILAGIALGALLASRFEKVTQRLFLFGILQIGIGTFAVLSLVVLSFDISVHDVAKLLIILTPTSIFMGMTFPTVTSIFRDPKKTGFNVGRAYAVNTAGSIVGPIVTGFLLIPLIGTTDTLISLALINILAGALLFYYEGKPYAKAAFFPLLIIAAILWTSTNKPLLFIENSLKNRVSIYQKNNWKWQLFEDEVATTLSFAGDSHSEKGLVIDGVQTTSLTTETKLLAHLPLLLHPNPKDLLVIAFGMGTTYRSALMYDQVNVDAVELVPSVPKHFTLFYDDAEEVLKNPRGKIIINDGRNYVLFTKKKYDVVVVDPPPPINAAGTTVLYSKEFYQDSKNVLKEGGIFVQWFWYGAQESDFRMLFAAMQQVFPHIKVAVSPMSLGVYFLASDQEINIDKDLLEQRLTEKVLSDLNEWEKVPYDVQKILKLFVGDELTVKSFIKDSAPLTDNNPNTEYFMIRQRMHPEQLIRTHWFTGEE